MTAAPLAFDGHHHRGVVYSGGSSLLGSMAGTKYVSSASGSGLRSLKAFIS
jgi:hypothetical protein